MLGNIKSFFKARENLSSFYIDPLIDNGRLGMVVSILKIMVCLLKLMAIIIGIGAIFFYSVLGD
ncbi:hypothetical protein UR09_04030 [Candidatus Nitromaritima sp. SCGC AAA799-A02]|nr:hypothetical protein UR09_04030 [Candidatus Nitromaritima sp. SCGC AAA799-A02]KMP11891.1 hypothetical protein UZ36_02970 [Candidatus Nitromaritima sp. SCGC AAA799-C22]